MFIELIGKLETYLSRTTRRSHSISATTQLAATLQFLATGSFQTVVASCHGISQPSLSRCICNVSNALCSCSSDFIRFPNEVGQRMMQQGFQHKFGFPKVLGCIDGSHIPIVAPSINEPLYVDRKGYHSINVQAICDDNSRFIDAVVKWPGCNHDTFMWRQSGIKQGISSGEIQTVDGWFLGDSGYPLSSKLITPILSPVTSRERRYNRAFLKTRKTIECTVGIWKSRWTLMDKTGGSLCYSPEVICKLIISTMVLHNFCIDHGLHTDIDIVENEDHSVHGNMLRQQIVHNYFSLGFSKCIVFNVL